ncbi:MAG: sugar transferase [Sumerlaeia bacterium]
MPLKTLRGTEFVALEVLTDGLFVFLGLLLAYWIRFELALIPTQGNWDWRLYAYQLPWAILFWLLSLHVTGNFRNEPLVITFNRARRLVIASGLALMLIIVRNYFFRIPDLARIMFPLCFVSVVVCLVAGRLLLQQFINRFLLGARLPRSRVLIVGTNPVAFRLAARIKKTPEYAQVLTGFLTSKEKNLGKTIGGAPVLGLISDLRRVLQDNAIQDVYITQNEVENDTLFQLFLESEKETARVHVIPSLSEMMRTTIYYDEVLSVPVYRMRDSPLQGGNLVVKRMVDVGASLCGLVFLSPLFLILGILVRLSSPGPIFFLQKRMGLNGESFNMIKFRTMPVFAEQNGPVWGDKMDRRSTGLGSFLRRWSLDELPQLVNVLRGEMSLVGPRPEQTAFIDQLKKNIPHYMSRHSVKTGMTGWAQVHGLRGRTSLAQRLRYDLYYIENWSLWLDLKILMMTLFRPGRPRTRIVPASVDRYFSEEESNPQHSDSSAEPYTTSASKLSSADSAKKS